MYGIRFRPIVVPANVGIHQSNLTSVIIHEILFIGILLIHSVLILLTITHTFTIMTSITPASEIPLLNLYFRLSISLIIL